MPSQRSSYTLEIVTSPLGRPVALVRDQDVGLTVTNDAENVVREVLSRNKVERILYRDSDLNWDELRHDGAEFTGFAPIRDPEGQACLPR